MKAQELRIGNWYDHNGEYKQASANTILDVWESDRIWCKPIELTPEILLACGFKNDYLEHYSLWVGKPYEAGTKVFSIDLSKHTLQFTIGTGGENVNYVFLPTPIKYLHQLQNLYWCLCGKELEIDLTKLKK